MKMLRREYNQLKNYDKGKFYINFPFKYAQSWKKIGKKDQGDVIIDYELNK